MLTKYHFYYLYRVLRTALPPRRLWHRLRGMLSYWLSRFGVVVRWRLYPLFVSIEPTNICNLKCPACPVGMRVQSVKPIWIDLALLDTLFEEIGRYTTHTILYFQGEPLLHRSFGRLVRLAHSRQLLTSTSTNAQLLDEAMAYDIVSAGLDRLIVSVDGTTQEVYESYRVGGSLDKALEGIRHVIACRERMGVLHPLVEVQFLVLKSNEHQMEEVKQLARQLKVDKLTFKSAQLYGYDTGHEQLTSIERYARYKKGADGRYHIKSKLSNHCQRLWQGAVVNSRGEVLPCCFDKSSQYVFGNIEEDGFLSAYHTPRAYAFRRALLADRRQFAMCRNCTE